MNDIWSFFLILVVFVFLVGTGEGGSQDLARVEGAFTGKDNNMLLVLVAIVVLFFVFNKQDYEYMSAGEKRRQC